MRLALDPGAAPYAASPVAGLGPPSCLPAGRQLLLLGPSEDGLGLSMHVCMDWVMDGWQGQG